MATETIISNIHCFQDLVYGDDIDIICVNETWLNENISISSSSMMTIPFTGKIAFLNVLEGF
jgi:hypothetical protein